MKTPLILSLLSLGFVACTTEPLFNFAVRGSLSSVANRGTGGATRLDVPIYTFYVATTPECLSPQVVIDYGGDPLIKDFAGDPVLFSGKLETGAYPCGILQVGDVLSFVASQEAQDAFGECSDALNPIDGYAADVVNLWRDLGGNPVNATGSVTNPTSSVVTLFFSTDPAALKAARDLPDEQVVALSKPFDVPGELTVFFDLTNAVAADSGLCILEQPFAKLGLR